MLGCVLLDPQLLGGPLKRVRGEHFYDLRHAILWDTMRVMFEKKKVIGTIPAIVELKKNKQLDSVGGSAYVEVLPDAVPSAANHAYYLEILLEKFALRKTLQVCTDTSLRIYDFEGGVSDFVQGVQSDLDVAHSLLKGDEKPALRVWRLSQLREWKEPDHLRLVGDSEIRMGYEGLTIVAGPGSSGKSLATASLALAGAIGAGTWMGRPVHRQFKTLIIQAENGKSRLKKELEAMAKNHPDVDIENHIVVSEPPEGGLPFHRAEFRAAIREQVAREKPALVILDPWSQVAADDTSKDVVDKIGEIRSCFPSGDDCPGLIIVAHTKKPRPEDVRRGRALAFSVAGSIALINTARCVYMLLPWNEELTDNRIYWACAKLNDGEMYAPSVWMRRFGTFFDCDTHTDPLTWGDEEDGEQQVSESEYFPGL